MKFSRLFLLALIPVAFVLSTNSSNAQESVAPDGQFGIWAGTGGFGIAYAIAPNIQLGTGFGLVLGDSPTTIAISPYGKFLLEGTVNPYILVALQITAVEDQDSRTDLRGAFGLDYYISPNVGVFGHITLIDLHLSPDPSSSNFGIGLSGQAGVEWFFN